MLSRGPHEKLIIYVIFHYCENLKIEANNHVIRSAHFLTTGGGGGWWDFRTDVSPPPDRGDEIFSPPPLEVSEMARARPL